MRVSYLAINILLLCVSVSCTGKKEKVKTYPIPVQVAEVKSMEYINNSFTGIVRSVQSTNIAFKIGGQLIKINVEEGQKIKQSHLIASIDPSDMELKVQAAKAAYIKSSLQLERFTRLVEKEAISQQEFESADAVYANDKANYENAKNMLYETSIYAPFSGVVERCYVDNFQRVQAAEPIITLVNPNDLEMTFVLSESLFPLMSASNKDFFVKFEVYPNQKFKAKLTKFVNSSVGGGYPVTVRIDDPTFNPEKFIVKPGFSCTVYVEVQNEQYANLVSIPTTAVAEDMGDKTKYVWIYNSSKGDVERRDIITQGLYGTSDIIISRGLKVGETVVTAGVYALTNGQKVKIIK